MSTENKMQTLVNAQAEIEKTSAFKTLLSFFDEGSFAQVDALAKSEDNYAEVVAGYGTVSAQPVFAFAQANEFCSGAMSKAQAAKLKKVYDLAVKTGTPVVGFYDSKGAKLSQGVDMLASYGAVLNSVSNLSGVVPQISVILGTCLGTGALTAASADFIIMTEKATLSLETASAKGGTAEEAAKAGISHITVKNTNLAIKKAQQLVTLLPSNNLSVAPMTEADEPTQAPKCPMEAVADNGSVIELQERFGAQAGTALARLAGNVVGFVGTMGGMLETDDCEKMARFVRFCDAFGIPVITMASSEGFDSLKGAAKVTAAYAEATTVKATVITGKAYGAFYIAVAGTGANADITMAWENAVISPLAPVTAAAVMWPDKMKVPAKEREAVVKQYEQQECSALNAAANGYVEDVIVKEDTRFKLYTSLQMLAGKRVTKLPKKHGTV